MVYNLLHIVLLSLMAAKIFSDIMKIFNADALWFHISGISSGVLVILGLIWAAVFLHGNNFARIPRKYKFLLPAGAVLAIISALLSK